MRSEKLLRLYQGDMTETALYREYRPYMNLCMAIIARACQDYASGNTGKPSGTKEYNRRHAETFFRSKWYRHIDYTGWFDPYEVMEQIDKDTARPSKFRTSYTKYGREHGEGEL